MTSVLFVRTSVSMLLDPDVAPWPFQARPETRSVTCASASSARAYLPLQQGQRLSCLVTPGTASRNLTATSAILPSPSAPWSEGA